MAAPRHGLGAHDGHRLDVADFNQSLQALFEFGRLHIIGEPAEGEIAPTGVERILTGMAKSPKLRKVSVADVCAEQGRAQLIAIELGIVTGAWNRPHIDQPADAVLLPGDIVMALGNSSELEVLETLLEAADEPSAAPAPGR